MPTTLSYARTLTICLTMLMSAGAARAAEPALPEANPESVGFSTERLARLEQTLHGMVADKQYAGMVTVLARHGKVVHFRASGLQNIAGNVPMQKNTIFYMASQTKPVTAAAMMMMYEEGRWRPEDPIAKHIPEFTDLKVFKGTDKDGKFLLEEPHHKPTMGELMSMSAGFSYASFGATNPIDRLYADTKVLQSANLQEMIDKIAKIPLLYQPGTRWVYSASVDIQGYLIEKWTGRKLAVFMRERLFGPLGMKDSSFQVPPDKLPRLSKLYVWDQAQNGGKGGLVETKMNSPEGTPPNVVSGAGGLYTTAEDYLRFAQMLVNGGALNGVRLLAPSSVLLMRSNHLPEEILAKGRHGLASALPNGFVMSDNIKNTDAFGVAFFRAQPGYGFAYNGDVIYDPVRVHSTVGTGTYHWGGAFGTWFWIDPSNDVVFVGMIQRADLHNMPDLVGIAQTMTYQALVDPKK